MSIRRLQRSALAALVVVVPVVAPSFAGAQKRPYGSLPEALRATAMLTGATVPENVVWIGEGNRYSYIKTDPQTGHSTIAEYDLATGRDSLLFTGSGLTFPGTTNPFEYEGFQWARDFKNIIFQSNFQQLYRRSGI